MVKRKSEIISRFLTPAITFWLKTQLEQVEDLDINISAGDTKILRGKIDRVSLTTTKAIYQGIYVNHAQRGRDWERPVDLTYITEEGETGFLVQERDSKAISGVLVKLLQDQQKINNIKYTARERMIQQFDWQVIANRYAKILNDNARQ